jgi:hypothetical protein
MPSAEFRPLFAAIKWLQTHPLDRTTTGIGLLNVRGWQFYILALGAELATDISVRQQCKFEVWFSVLIYITRHTTEIF